MQPYKPQDSSNSKQHNKEVLKYQQNLVQYDHLLKQLSNENQEQLDSVGSVRKQGFELLVGECERVGRFVASVADNLWLDLIKLAEELPSLEDGFVSDVCLACIPSYRGLLSTIGEELVELDGFIATNVKYCVKLAQLIDYGSVDANLSEGKMEQYTNSFTKTIVGDISLEPILIGLSDTYAHLSKLVQARSNQGEDKWVAPDRFQRQTTKFWLRFDNVLKFKTVVIKYLPILIYNDRNKLQFGRPNTTLRFLQDERIRDYADISSVYVDNASLWTYHQRLVREDGATLARIRWYGEREMGDFQKLYVERKLHREFWTGEFSLKERSPVKQCNIQAFLCGSSNVPELHDRSDNAKADLLREIQDFIFENDQKPMIRTSYKRVAFQHPTDNIVRISLDTDVRMLNEHNAPRLSGDWCRDTNIMCEDDVVRFPYAIVEVKLQDAAPDWVRELIDTGLLVPVPKFSKFLHGMAMMFGDKVESTPYWFLPTGDGFMSPATIEEMADNYDPYQVKGASWLWPKMPNNAFQIGNPPEVVEVDANDFIEFPRRDKKVSKRIS